MGDFISGEKAMGPVCQSTQTVISLHAGEEALGSVKTESDFNYCTGFHNFVLSRPFSEGM